MTKYNITPKKVKMAAYRNLVNPELMDRLETQIYDIIVKQKKYLDTLIMITTALLNVKNLQEQDLTKIFLERRMY